MTESLWKDVAVESVENLPEGIDGLKVYKMKDFQFNRSYTKVCSQRRQEMEEGLPDDMGGT